MTTHQQIFPFQSELVSIARVSPFLARLAMFVAFEAIVLAVSALAGVLYVILVSRGSLASAGSVVRALFQPIILMIAVAVAFVGAVIFSVPYGWTRGGAAVVGMVVVIWITQLALKHLRRKAQHGVAT